MDTEGHREIQESDPGPVANMTDLTDRLAESLEGIVNRFGVIVGRACSIRRYLDEAEAELAKAEGAER